MIRTIAGAATEIKTSIGSASVIGSTAVLRDPDGTIEAEPTLAGASGFALDISGGSATPGVVIPNNGTVSIGGVGVFSGLVVINDTATTGSLGLFLCGGSAGGALIGTNGTADYSAVLGTAGKLNLAYSAGTLTLENKTGVTRTVNVMALRTRAHQ